MGDININVNNTSNTNSKDFDAYLNMLTSNGAFLLIDKPTRVTNTTSSNIDHIITKSSVCLVCSQRRTCFSAKLRDFLEAAAVLQ